MVLCTECLHAALIGSKNRIFIGFCKVTTVEEKTLHPLFGERIKVTSSLCTDKNKDCDCTDFEPCTIWQRAWRWFESQL